MPMMLSSVDFPAPEGPMMVTNSPRLISSVIRRRRKNLLGPASTAFSRLRIRIRGSTVVQPLLYFLERSLQTSNLQNSLVAQRDQWIDARRPPRRDRARQQNNSRHKESDPTESHRVSRFYAVEHARHRAPRCE